jgi:hypothetical protein
MGADDATERRRKTEKTQAAGKNVEKAKQISINCIITNASYSAQMS